MTNLGWHVDEDMFVNKTPIGDKTFVNVIATHSPSIARRLTLACHYDSKLMTEAEFIGATDSAVPCAMMIDLARHLNASLAQSPDRDIALQFMFFDGEEAFEKWTDSDSLYGSRHLASKMLDTTVSIGDGLTVTQVKTIDALLLLDLIGSYDTKFANWFSATEHLYRRLQQIENELYDSHLLDSPEHNHYFTGNMYQSMEFYGGIQDDHVPFHQKGVPVVHLISYPFPSVWHKPSDNETALHYPTIRDIGKILRVFVTEYLGLVV
jgi:glutaminyl-peptide cyclotransferase